MSFDVSLLAVFLADMRPGDVAKLAAPDADVSGWLEQQCRFSPAEAAAVATRFGDALRSLAPQTYGG